jgi:GNAT superfamily N-acetyltransferase
VSSYRFCRTDDIALLVDALNRCWSPHFPGDPAMTPATFKRSIRDLQVWCSSCMVAFSGADPIGVLIGAKRPSGTLVHRIAVHPDHLRMGHGRHLLNSLGSKLAILGPPRIIAEVPTSLGAACALFAASGFVEEACLTDYVWSPDARGAAAPGEIAGRFVIPVTLDDLAANGLLDDAGARVCWQRSIESLTARKDDICGLAIASDERIEAYILHAPSGAGATAPAAAATLAPAAAAAAAVEILSLRSFVEDGGAALRHLLARLGAGAGVKALSFPRVHATELPAQILDTLGFRPAGGYRLFAATARAD